jgi:hypothetical protein
MDCVVILQQLDHLEDVVIVHKMNCNLIISEDNFHVKRHGCISFDSKLLGDLKTKVICDFKQLLKKIEKGYRLDYEFILEEMMLINLIEENEVSLEDALFYLEFYNTNDFNSKEKDKWLI